MANKNYDLAHIKWMCKYHIVFTPKYRRKVIYNQLKADIRDILKQLCSYKGVEIDSYDGLIFLDYMKQCNEFDEPEVYNAYMLKTKAFISRSLNIYAGNAKVVSKYEWLKWYYNETVASIFSEPEQFLIC